MEWNKIEQNGLQTSKVISEVFDLSLACLPMAAPMLGR